MKLIKVLSYCAALVFCAGGMLCRAMNGEKPDPEKAFNKTFKGQSSEIVVVTLRKGEAIQVITGPKLINKLREKIKEMVYYDDPFYCSLISACSKDCSVIDYSHHFYINKEPNKQNIEKAKIIIKNALFRMGYTKIVWQYTH
ncbi:MAG: hypothetical protein IJI84_05930 [Clostridia bacterium]|nr:hypothetical protein [Clostridia bacterium]